MTSALSNSLPGSEAKEIKEVGSLAEAALNFRQKPAWNREAMDRFRQKPRRLQMKSAMDRFRQKPVCGKGIDL